MKAFVVMIVLFFSTSPVLAIDVVKYPWVGKAFSTSDGYYAALLELALEKSKDKFGPYEIQQVVAGESQEHMVRLIQEEKFVNLFWTMTSSKREELLTPIRFPLFKGLLGCRVFLIKKGQQTRFDHLTDAEQLKTLFAGQGEDWPDTEILSAHRFKLATSSKDVNLFKMLSKERFDYFPRALHEARLEALEHPDLTIEKRFLLYYDSPFYFFVNKTNQRLAQRLTFGLNVAVEDGSFEQFFNTHPVSADLLNQFNLAQRELLILDNPSLSQQSRQALNKLATRENCIGKSRNKLH